MSIKEINENIDKLIDNQVIPMGYRLIHNITKQVWVYENDNGSSVFYKKKHDAIRELWESVRINITKGNQ